MTSRQYLLSGWVSRPGSPVPPQPFIQLVALDATETLDAAKLAELHEICGQALCPDIFGSGDGLQLIITSFQKLEIAPGRTE